MPDVSYPTPDGPVSGYLAVPAGGGPWPGVVVIFEATGLNDDIRGKADELAAHGYLALAPDLYRGRSWVRCVRAAFRQLKDQSGPAFTALEAARGYLAGRPDSTGVTGAIGFCMGGGFALLLAPRPGWSAVAVNYGEVPQDAEAVLAGACPVVASYGGRDKALTTKPPERLQRALTVLEIAHDVQVYPGSGHRFMTEASGPAGVLARVMGMTYQRHDAQDAWQRIYAFFGRYLRPPAG
jgi:carboxymethylenebutenolidase